MKYRVLIVDDEEPARDLLANYASKIEELDVIAVHSNALDAKKTIQNEKIEILLTDIQMDDLTGIDLLKMLKNPPVTIFTTAYSEYALEGYDLDIIDYLVKPISFNRFCRAIDKAVELINYKRQAADNPQTTHKADNSTSVSTYFFVKTDRKLVKVFYADILFVQSYGEYVKIYTKDDVILALQTTGHMEDLLPSGDFFRIHRSHIVNINHISEIVGNMVVIENHKLPVSKRSKEGFMKMIANKGIA